MPPDPIQVELSRAEAKAIAAVTEGVRGPLSPIVSAGRQKLCVALDQEDGRKSKPENLPVPGGDASSVAPDMGSLSGPETPDDKFAITAHNLLMNRIGGPGAPGPHSPAPDPGQVERVTHGRHCPCSACARQDWSDPQLAPCGMHGPSCPPRYAPYPKGPESSALAAALPEGQVTVDREDLERACRDLADLKDHRGDWISPKWKGQIAELLDRLRAALGGEQA